MKRYLRLTRAHTAPLEAVPAALGAAIAVGNLAKLPVILWAVYGLLYHLAGYGMNSYTDWKSGYDKEDEHKQHHPLNRGTVRPIVAKYLSYGLVMVTVAYGIYISSGDYAAISLMGVGYLSGISYNKIGKSTDMKFVLISIAHSTVFMVPYVALGGKMNSAGFVLLSVSMFFWITFQISVSGEVKDMDSDESNLLKSIGAEYKVVERYGDDIPAVEFSNAVRVYGVVLRVLLTIMLVISAVAIGSHPMSVEVILIAIMGAVSVVYTLDMLSNSLPWDRDRHLSNMSLIELITACSFTLSVTKVIGVPGVIIVIFISVVWITSMNRLMWGTLVAPRV